MYWSKLIIFHNVKFFLTITLCVFIYLNKKKKAFRIILLLFHYLLLFLQIDIELYFFGGAIYFKLYLIGIGLVSFCNLKYKFLSGF